MEILKNVINNAWWSGRKLQMAVQETARTAVINTRIKRTEAKLAFDRKFKK